MIPRQDSYLSTEVKPQNWAVYIPGKVQVFHADFDKVARCSDNDNQISDSEIEAKANTNLCQSMTENSAAQVMKISWQTNKIVSGELLFLAVPILTFSQQYSIFEKLIKVLNRFSNNKPPD